MLELSCPLLGLEGGRVGGCEEEMGGGKGVGIWIAYLFFYLMKREKKKRKL